MSMNMVLKHKRQTDGSSHQISLTKKDKDCPKYVGNAGKDRVKGFSKLALNTVI